MAKDIESLTGADATDFAAVVRSAANLGASATTDAPPTAAVVHGGNAYPQATGGNQAGADLNLTGGIGSRFFTVVDFSVLAGKIVTIVTNGVSVTLTEGVDWTAATSNAATATSLAAAIGATAAAVGDIVYITPASTARTLTISTDGGADLTATMGTDGRVLDGVIAQITTSATPITLSEPFAAVYEVTTTGPSGDEFINLSQTFSDPEGRVNTPIKFILADGSAGGTAVVRGNLGSDLVIMGSLGEDLTAVVVPLIATQPHYFRWTGICWTYSGYLQNQSFENTPGARRRLPSVDAGADEGKVLEIVSGLPTWATSLALLPQTRITTAQFDKTNSSTFENIPGLSVNLAAGETYTFEVVLFTVSDAAAGVKAQIAGACTKTYLLYEITIFDDTVIVLQDRESALGDDPTGAPTAATARIEITGTIIVNAAGTLTVQFAENTAVTATTSSVLTGSKLTVTRVS